MKEYDDPRADVTEAVDEQGNLWRRCIVCSRPYYINANAQESFLAKGLALPRRCWPCRRRRQHEWVA